MKKNKFLFFLILILAILASSLILWRLFFLPAGRQVIISQPTPTPLPTPFISKQGKGDSPTEIMESLKKNFPLLQILPYETETYSVDYIGPLHLKVKLKSGSQRNKVEQEVKEWLLKQQVEPSTHKIDFTPVP